MDTYATLKDLCERVAALEARMAPEIAVEDDRAAASDSEPIAEAPVNFASDSAERLAVEAGLTAADFAAVQPKGATGYTTADVRAVIAART